jgi:hypothetical protein
MLLGAERYRGSAHKVDRDDIEEMAATAPDVVTAK